jgi:hypothetical protein
MISNCPLNIKHILLFYFTLMTLCFTFKASKCSQHLDIFKREYKTQRSGSSAYLLMSFRKIENLMTLKEPTEKIRIFWTLLKGQALSYFENHLKRRLQTEGSKLPENGLIELVIRGICLEIHP